MAMMQQQRRPGAESQLTRQPVPSAPPRELLSSSTMTASTVGSQSLTARRLALGQSYFDAAKTGVAEALGKDEAGDRMAALELYNKVLSSLSLGLGQVKRGDTGMADLMRKMEKMKEQVKLRMEVLLQQETQARQLSASTTSRSSEPVSRTGQASVSASTTSRAGVGSTSVRERVGGGGTRVSAKADLVFNVDTGIGLFQVDGRDHVRKYEDVDNVSVFRYHERIKGQPPAFLQCNGFIYPLIPGRSPVLKASDNVYMFPDLKGEDGCTVGLTLEGASKEEIAEMDRLLTVMADLRSPETAIGVGEREKEGVREKDRERERKGIKDREREREGIKEREREGIKEREREGLKEEREGEKPTWGTTIAGGIEKGVGLVSKGIAIGTEAAGSLISKGASKLRERIEPNEQATEIPEPVQKGVHVAKKASGYVVGVSDFLMMSLAKLTVKVGKEVKNVVAESEYVKSREINPHAKEAWTVTKSGVKGAAAVFGDLERGASALLSSVGHQTAKTVEHKYGEQAGQVTAESLETGKNVAKLTYTYWSWKTWGIQFLGKVGEVIRKEDDSSKQSPSTDTKHAH